MTEAHFSEKFFGFMEDYTEFLERMVADEDEKLAALNSRELSRIEHSIAVSQANAKRLENLESQRVALQSEAGCADKTFRQLAKEAPAEAQHRIQQLFSRFERNVSEIRFRNDKSMSVARDRMMEIDPESVLDEGVQNPYAKARAARNATVGMLETKA